jgi:hypothetical protein
MRVFLELAQNLIWFADKKKVDTEDSYEALNVYINDIHKQNEEINKLCLDLKECSLFEVNTTSIKEEFNKTCKEIVKYVLDKIYSHLGKRIEQIDFQYKDI